MRGWLLLRQGLRGILRSLRCRYVGRHLHNASGERDPSPRPHGLRGNRRHVRRQVQRFERRLCLFVQHALWNVLVRGEQLPGCRDLQQRCLQHTACADLFERLRTRFGRLCGLHARILPMLRYSASEVRFNWNLAELRQPDLQRILRDLHFVSDHCNLHECHHTAVGKVLQRHRCYLQGLLQRFHSSLHIPG